MFLLLATISTSSHAEGVTVGDQRVTFVYPGKYCVAGSHPREVEIRNRFAAATGQLRLRALFADCMELEELKSGKRAALDHYGTYFLMAPNGNVAYVKDQTRRQFIEQMAGQMVNGKLQVDELVKKVEQRLVQMGAQTKSMEPLGLLGADSFGAYTGILSNTADQDRRHREILGVSAITVVKTVPVSVGLYRGGPISRDLRGLLSEVQTLTESFVQANE